MQNIRVSKADGVPVCMLAMAGIKSNTKYAIPEIGMKAQLVSAATR